MNDSKRNWSNLKSTWITSSLASHSLSLTMSWQNIHIFASSLQRYFGELQKFHPWFKLTILKISHDNFWPKSFVIKREFQVKILMQVIIDSEVTKLAMDGVIEKSSPSIPYITGSAWHWVRIATVGEGSHSGGQGSGVWPASKPGTLPHCYI